MWKAREKRCVFNRDLKMLIDLAALIWGGRLFQSSGAATAKARSPLDLSVRLLGTASRDWSADLRALGGLCLCISSAIYGGARSFRDLKVNKRILKSILCLMGSQWREIKTGVMWSNFLVPVRRRAAAF